MSTPEAECARLLFVEAKTNAIPEREDESRTGPPCVFAESVEALKRADLSDVDAVACDASLPTEALLDALTHVRRVRAELPFFLTGDPRHADRMAKLLRAGATGFLASHADLRALHAVVHQCLAHQRIAEENRRLHKDLAESRAREEETQQEFETVIQQLQVMARTDELTGLANRRWLNIMLAGAWAESIRNDLPLAFLMIDLDGFKTLNDDLGHQRGDAMLRLAGKVIDANCRDVDTPARYGGDEFCVLMPHTEAGDALVVAERIVRAFEEAVSALPADEPRVGMSIGLSHLHLSHAVNADELVSHADEALYAAKALGKNRVVARERDGVYVPMSRGSGCPPSE